MANFMHIDVKYVNHINKYLLQTFCLSFFHLHHSYTYTCVHTYNNLL